MKQYILYNSSADIPMILDRCEMTADEAKIKNDWLRSIGDDSRWIEDKS